MGEKESYSCIVYCKVQGLDVLVRLVKSHRSSYTRVESRYVPAVSIKGFSEMPLPSPQTARQSSHFV